VLLASALPATAQFGGREGEAVFYMLTSKGAGDIIAMPDGAANSAAAAGQIRVTDPATLPQIPLGPPFSPAFVRQIFHDEPDNLFQLVTQYAPDAGPHRIFLTTFKTFIVSGVVRETEFDNLDYTTGSMTTLKRGVNFGPDQAIITLEVLFWTNSLPQPYVDPVPLGVSGPAVPPGKTGEQVILELGKVPRFIPWKRMRRVAPGANWPDGVDLKFLEYDPEEGSTIQMLRLRRGARTLNFRIPGDTHLYLLEGSAELNAPGRGILAMKARDYAYIPRNAVVQLANPRARGGLR
jgi:hypothetical protein